MHLRRLGIAFLTLQSVGATLWWILLLLAPQSRSLFLVPNAPESTLMGFLLPDLLLFIGGGLLSAWGLAKCTPWRHTALALHTGAATYAGLHTLALPLCGGHNYWGIVMMSPSLLFLPFLLWKMREEKEP